MKQVDQQMRCDVCGASGPVQVAASAIGPATLDYCGACAARGAEPFLMVATRLWAAGGPSGDIGDLSEITTFVDGRYVGLDSVLERYDEQLEQEIRDAFFG